VIPVHMPPLRERREDIPLLAERFLRRFAKEMSKPVEGISTAAMQKLVAFRWPGNVRELENVIERAVALETSPVVLPERLPDFAPGAESQGSADEATLPAGFSLDDHIHQLEGRYLRRALGEAGGDRATAARLLGATPRSLRYLIQKHEPSATGE
jgi:two-component system, NtrC family, response regulator PilR